MLGMDINVIYNMTLCCPQAYLLLGVSAARRGFGISWNICHILLCVELVRSDHRGSCMRHSVTNESSCCCFSAIMTVKIVV